MIQNILKATSLATQEALTTHFPTNKGCLVIVFFALLTSVLIVGFARMLRNLKSLQNTKHAEEIKEVEGFTEELLGKT